MSTQLYSRVRAMVTGMPWLVMPSVMDVIAEVLTDRLSGRRYSPEEIAERIAAAERVPVEDIMASSVVTAGPRAGGNRRTGAVAVIPIYGVLAHRAQMLEDTSTSGTSVQGLQRAFREAMADPDVQSILFDVDSPGGYVSGIPELAAEIRGARGQKPMAAISNTLMASAAYYLASQADEVIVSQSSYTGSVGVVMAHEDRSGEQEKAGVVTTFVYAGDYKVEGHPFGPLEDEARSHMQSMVETTYQGFVSAVAGGRGVGVQKVRDDFGKGRVMGAKEAVAAGMADRVGTFDDALRRLAGGQVKPRTSLAPAASYLVGEDGPESIVPDAGESNDRSDDARAALELARAKSA